MATLAKHRLVWTLALGLTGRLFGFQVADGSPEQVRAPEKFIFYWGNAQATLSVENKYRAQWKLKPAAFQQMLLQWPRLWNGRTMEERVCFRLEGVPVIATPGGAEYESLLSELHERFATKATPGQRYTLTDLTLTPELLGNIEIQIEEETPSSQDLPARERRYPGSWIDHRLVAAVIWGWGSSEPYSRDYFTPREALQILLQQPAVVWQTGIAPQPVYADIQFSWDDEGQHGFRALLDAPDAYQQIIHSVNRYLFLLRPGVRVTLSLYSNRYDRLYEHTLRLVSDTDPRLALRRQRDGHRVRLQWGPIEHTWESLYLTCFTGSSGEPLPADPSFTVWSTLAQASLPELLAHRPALWIDDVRILDLTFSLSTDRHTVRLSAEEAPSLKDLQNDADSTLRLHLHHLSAAGYDLSGLSVGVHLIAAQTLPLPLLKRPASNLVLYQPTVSNDAIEVTFDLPASTTLHLSILNSQGTAAYRLEGFYSAGRHTLSLPRRQLPASGSYTMALTTPYGSVHQSLVIE